MYVCTAFYLVLQSVRLVRHLCILCHCGGPALPDEPEMTLGLFDSLQHLTSITYTSLTLLLSSTHFATTKRAFA